MEMFLMAAIMSLLGVAVCAVLFAAATRDEAVEASQSTEQRAAVPQRFFASAPAAEVLAAPPSPRAPEGHRDRRAGRGGSGSPSRSAWRGRWDGSATRSPRSCAS